MVFFFNNKIWSSEFAKFGCFYSEIKSVGILCLVFGLFPFENAFETGTHVVLSFRRMSVVNLYSIMGHLAMVSTVLITLQYFTEMRSLVRGGFTAFELSFVFLSTQTSNFALPLFISKIYEIDAILVANKISLAQSRASARWKFCFDGVLFVVIICSVFFFTICYESTEFLENGRYALHATITGIKLLMKLQLILVAFLYVVTCQGFLRRIESVNLLTYNCMSVSIHDLTVKLETVRLLQSKIHSASNFLNSCFSLRLMSFFSFTYIEILFVYYRDIIIQYNGVFLGVITISYLGISMFLVSRYSQKMLLSSQSILSDLRNISFKSLPISSMTQVRELMKETTAEPVTISGAGYFKVSNNSLACLTGSLAAMMTVILQMHQEYGQYVKTNDNITDYNHLKH